MSLQRGRMRLRPSQLTEIQYIIVPKRSTKRVSFLPPEELSTEILNFIRRCPKDLLQLSNPLGYFATTRKYLFQKGYELVVIYDDDLSDFLDEFDSRKQIQLVFIDSNSTLFESNLLKLANKKQNTRFFFIYGDTGTEMSINRRIFSPNDLLRALFEQQEKIMKEIQISDLSINPRLDISSKDFFVRNFFAAAHNNSFTIRAITGNYYDTESAEEGYYELAAKESQKAHQNQDTFERQNFFVSQIQRIDHFDKTLLNEKLIERITGAESIFSPLIIIAPFHSPDIKKILEDKTEPRARDVSKKSQTNDTSTLMIC